MKLRDIDKEFMLRAIAIGENGRLSAPPNPWVGCVIVKSGNIIAEGFHRAPGESHAEVVALSMAEDQAKGATLYSTLEPCSHHGRTPPCVDAIIKAGIKRVVVGVLDPDMQVSGKGVAKLRSAGIQVDVAIAEEEVKQSLQPYLHHRRHKTPYCLAKVATTIDGRIAAKDGSSQWITCSEARADAHNLRAESQAIMVGVGTAMRDKPKLTARDSKYDNPKHPLRVILDSKGLFSPPSPLLDVNEAPTLIVTSEKCSTSKKKEWKKLGAQVLVAPLCSNSGMLEVAYIMKELAKIGILQLMVEGGSRLHTSLMCENHINKLVMYVGPKIIGSDGIPFLQKMNLETMKNAIELNFCGAHPLGNTVRLEYEKIDKSNYS